MKGEIGMKKYKVWVQLEELEGIYEAESEEDAFIQASDDAMAGCDWMKKIEEIEDEEK